MKFPNHFNGFSGNSQTENMKKIISISVLILIINTTILSQPQPTQAYIFDDIYLNLQTKYDSIKTFQSDFEQLNFWIELDVQKKSYGKIYYDETKLLLDYSEPAGQKMLIDSTTVTIYDSTSNQALISNKVETELRPIKFISLYWENSQKEIIEQNEDYWKIKISTQFEENILVEIKNYLITGFTFFDKEGNSVQYNFLNEKINEQLPENVFELILPKDVNIIDNRM